MRLFIAIELPNDIKVALAAIQADLRQAQAKVSWTQPENLHLTLKFLGEVEPQRLPEVTRACADAALSVAPFSLQLSGTGGFPNLKQPRVLWAGLAQGLRELQTLHHELNENLSRAGFENEAGGFKPHLTLGRVKSLQNMAIVTARLQAYPLPTLSFQVQELVVMQSQLHAAGSIYMPLVRCDLNG